ncbi:uncharacterized protein G2W53_014443 [Senna tora]|uniref:Uncharacterized protein n=1 Tax=Senna tora TaxID=362788 RepID=A0A835C5P0_9FABA|nr:uncharacterized protein G2W53_014443 [Senna tora]
MAPMPKSESRSRPHVLVSLHGQSPAVNGRSTTGACRRMPPVSIGGGGQQSPAVTGTKGKKEKDQS